jgi:glycosyltransferase involved in cell wall biosynthesis
MIILIMRFSVIAANFEKEDVLSLFFSSFLGIPKTVSWELIFVDDGSRDKSVSVARSFSDKLPIQIIEGLENRGPAHARNVGLKEAQSNLIVFCDTDITFHFPVLLDAIKFFLKKELDVFTFNLGIRPLRSRWMGKIYLLEEYENLEALNIRSGSHPYFSTTFSLAKKTWILELGGFDERYKGADIEDLVLAFEAKEETKYWFSREHTFCHDYPVNSNVFRKAFTRSYQLASLNAKALENNPFLDNTFRKYGYILTLIWCLFVLAFLFCSLSLDFLLLMTVIEICYHYRMYSLGVSMYGAFFGIVIFFGRLIYVLSAFFGYVLGKVYPKKAA